MHVKVRLFAMLRQQAGWRERDIELPEGATIGYAWQFLIDETPALAAQRDSVRFALNREYATADHVLSDTDELALIPPVAGGAIDDPDATYVRLQITAQPITDDLLGELRRAVPTTADGAFVLFLGQTRDNAEKPVVSLEYEVFNEMALNILHAIAAEIEERFGVTRLAIIHRSGEVPLGEASVVVCAASAHRNAAFEAARYGIEELKARAPIWKNEQYTDGSVWIGTPPRDGPVDG